MKRRDFFKYSFFAGIALVSCISNNKKKSNHYLNSKVGKIIALEGEILHVCPIEKLKMKLKLPDGEIIRVVNKDGKLFDKERWNRKKVCINGKLDEMKISRDTINTNFEKKKLLCHIDYTPCIDTKWIENQWKNNSAEKILNRYNNDLILRMQQTEQDYIQVFTIIADEIALL